MSCAPDYHRCLQFNLGSKFTFSCVRIMNEIFISKHCNKLHFRGVFKSSDKDETLQRPLSFLEKMVVASVSHARVTSVCGVLDKIDVIKYSTQ